MIGAPKTAGKVSVGSTSKIKILKGKKQTTSWGWITSTGCIQFIYFYLNIFLSSQ